MNFLPPQTLFIALKYLPVFLQKPDLPRRGKPSLLRTPPGSAEVRLNQSSFNLPFCLSFGLISLGLMAEGEEPAGSQHRKLCPHAHGSATGWGAERAGRCSASTPALPGEAKGSGCHPGDVSQV